MLKKSVLFVFALLFLVSIGVSVYFYTQNKKLIANPEAIAEVESAQILKKIGAVLDLPSEKPTIITVVDREKLQDQEFFKKAANGDKIIVYEGVRRLILYRPSTGKVVDVVPLALNETNTLDLPVETPASTPGTFGE